MCGKEDWTQQDTIKYMKRYKKIVWEFNPSVLEEVIQRIAFSFGYDWDVWDYNSDTQIKMISSDERMIFDPNTKKISVVHYKYDCIQTRWALTLPRFLESIKDPSEMVDSPSPATKSNLNLNLPLVSFIYHNRQRLVRVTKMYNDHLEGFEIAEPLHDDVPRPETYKKYRVDKMESDPILTKFLQE